MAGINGGIIPNNLFRLSNLNENEKNFLFYMISLDNRFGGDFFLSRREMADELGYRSPKTITNNINKLIELGFVTKKRIGKKMKNTYSINWDFINRIGKVKLEIGQRLDITKMEPVEAPKHIEASNPTPEPQKPVKQAKEAEPEVRSKVCRLPDELYNKVMGRIAPHIYEVSFKNLKREEIEPVLSKMIGKTRNMSYDDWKEEQKISNSPLWMGQLWSAL